MSDREQRQVLEVIARDETLYPRDRIMAVKALQEMAKVARERRAKRPVQRPSSDLDREFEEILGD
jgi:hypothetical protein